MQTENPVILNKEEGSMLQIDPLSFISAIYTHKSETKKLASTLLCQFYIATRRARRYVHTDEKYVIGNIEKGKNPYRAVRDYQDKIEREYIIPLIQVGYSYAILSGKEAYKGKLSTVLDELDDFIEETRASKSLDIEDRNETFMRLTKDSMKSIVKILYEIEKLTLEELSK